MKKLCELMQKCREKGISILEGKGLSKEALLRKLAEDHLQNDP